MLIAQICGGRENFKCINSAIMVLSIYRNQIIQRFGKLYIHKIHTLTVASHVRL